MIELLIFAVGVYIGWKWHTYTMLKNIISDPTRMIRLMENLKKLDELDEDDRELVEVEIERVDNVYFIYSKISKEFLAQGTSVEEALESVHSRFPNQTFKGIIPKDKAEEWGLSK